MLAPVSMTADAAFGCPLQPESPNLDGLQEIRSNDCFAAVWGSLHPARSRRHDALLGYQPTVDLSGPW